MQKRTVFFVSDRTAITAETLGHSLLTQFDTVQFEKKHRPFINSPAKAQALVTQINQAAEQDGNAPLVFSTLLDCELIALLRTGKGLLIDFFETFNPLLAQELNAPPAYIPGRSHGMGNYAAYTSRIAALNYSLNNDDGQPGSDYQNADLILVGVSRSGKTPTSLYLSLQYGILAANYPLTEEDLENNRLPKSLQPYRNKLFGLTIQADRLHQIRSERYPNSRYAELPQCRSEVRLAENLFRRERLDFVDTTTMSVEEIAAMILQEAGLERRLW